MKFTKGNVVGFATRFGDQWQGLRCGSKTRSGSKCRRPAYKRSGKCHLHVGASTGPRTKAGLARLTEVRTKHGKFTKEKRADAKRRAEQGRQMLAELLELESWFIDNLHLKKNWRKDWDIKFELVISNNIV